MIIIIRYVRAQPALAYEKNQWKTEFLFLVPFVYNSFILKIRRKHFCLVFLEAMVDLHWGGGFTFIKLSHMHIVAICQATCLSCPSLWHMNSDLTGQWASCTNMIFRTFFHLKLNTLYLLQ